MRRLKKKLNVFFFLSNNYFQILKLNRYSIYFIKKCRPPRSHMSRPRRTHPLYFWQIQKKKELTIDSLQSWRRWRSLDLYNLRHLVHATWSNSRVHVACKCVWQTNTIILTYFFHYYFEVICFSEYKLFISMIKRWA